VTGLTRQLDEKQIREKASEFYWYHCIDLGQGVVTEGDFDMREYWPAYQFPDVSGKTLLDVGRASGFFSFEFERLGANVTATEIASFLDWDFVGGDIERAKRSAQIGDVQAFTEKHITGAFNFAHAVLGSRVRKVTTTIYDISPESVGGKFDVVFGGSVTSHLRDPILGLEKLRHVTADNGVCVVAAPYLGLHEEIPLAAMVGTADVDRRSWWVLNRRCLVELLKCAGFSKAEIVGDMTIKLRRKTENVTEFPHIVAHAYP
jgi:tRNA (mo5U34)-methyltransferase